MEIGMTSSSRTDRQLLWQGVHNGSASACVARDCNYFKISMWWTLGSI
jgi:hypothetical protein